ncbi:hypothetical protein PYH69_13045 [Mammaliicoccus lentus]|uniref:Translation elongation factor n=1 Tax=Mammaliicoccus lentus TaxID=42858 RepID=A0AAX3W4D9_MAMLE|nr:hypothetical protein [Mammaliicoccus lentus]WHI59624.1 hypothetical protein PYH69_13045 [Mammaliicoccus lentus]
MGKEENKKKKNDIAWEKLFEKYNILEALQKEKLFKIKSSDINKVREARLMTKFDKEIDLPKIFKKNNLSILPIGRGEYVLGKFKTYFEIKSKEPSEPKIMKLPQKLTSIDTKKITSESVAINVAFASGMIDDLLNSSELNKAYLTITGRMGSKLLNFNIDSKIKGESPYEINVENSQIEIDSAFENKEKILLIEAKIDEKKDFNIRQLFYPYLFLKNKLLDKEILPVLLIYTQGSFIFNIYKFKDETNYSSIKFLEQKVYKLSDEINISMNEVISIMKTVNIVEDRYKEKTENFIPFPQANSFNIVLKLIEFISNNDKTKSDIALKFGFSERQSTYYHDALRFLGYSNELKNGSTVTLNKNGMKVLKIKNEKVGKLHIIEDILKDRIMNEAMRKTIKDGKVINIKDCFVLLNENLDLSQETKERRASTVRQWIIWIINNTDSINDFKY